MSTNDRQSPGDRRARSRDGLAHRLWAAYLCIGLSSVVLYFAVPARAVQSVVYLALSASSVAAIVCGVVIHKPRQRLAWSMIAASVASLVIGNTIASVSGWMGVQLGYPSIADVFFLLNYPLAATGLGLLLHSRMRALDRTVAIDSMIAATAAGLLLWTYLISGNLIAPMPLLPKLAAVASPVADVVLVLLVVRLGLGGRLRVPSLAFVTTAVCIVVLSDSAYGLLSINGGYKPGHAIDAGWLLQYVAWGIAALHPSVKRVMEPDKATRSGRMRLPLLALSLLTAPLLKATGHTSFANPVIVAGLVLLVVLVLVRMSGLVRRAESQRARLAELVTALEAADVERGMLLERTLSAAEDERAKVAVELHDGPIQHLSAVGLRLRAHANRLSRSPDSEDAGLKLLDLGVDLSREIDGLRRMMTGLRPPALDQRGLGDAIRDHAGVVLGTTCSVRLESRLDGRLDRESETLLFRGSQEVLRNIARHAHATRVGICLDASPDGVSLTVADNGIGMEDVAIEGLVRSGRFGLAGVKERLTLAGGSITVRRRRGGGTVVRMSLPTHEVGHERPTALATTS